LQLLRYFSSAPSNSHAPSNQIQRTNLNTQRTHTRKGAVIANDAKAREICLSGKAPGSNGGRDQHIITAALYELQALADPRQKICILENDQKLQSVIANLGVNNNPEYTIIDGKVRTPMGAVISMLHQFDRRKDIAKHISRIPLTP
jgi:hypothetical protein